MRRRACVMLDGCRAALLSRLHCMCRTACVRESLWLRTLFGPAILQQQLYVPRRGRPRVVPWQLCFVVRSTACGNLCF